MIKDYFSKEIWSNITNDNEKRRDYSLMAPVDYRAPKERYEKFYAKEQLEYLFAHNFIQEYTPTGATWKHPWIKKGDYYEFTDYGKKLRVWYASSLKDYLYYNVFHIYKIHHWWQNFRIWCGYHYDWQDYIEVNLNEI